MLGIFALAAAMAAEGVQTLAEMRERHYVILARQEAASPLPYHAPLPALHALVPAVDGGGRVLVRADSAGARAAALCALAAEADVRWIALSAAVDPCVAERPRGRMIRASAPAAAELGGARWMVMDAGGRALYSSRTIPSGEELRRTAALLAPDVEAGR
ncbi:MAG TPA: hypothetical protein VFR37_16260 [Longimicrobium sp.]|nr:hypothetical protein [Longimicrobium sp.]